MARVRGLASERLLSALILVVMTLFVASGVPGAGRWRRPLRLAALAGFAVALLLALGAIARWLAAAGR
jgi:hypothetical protein